MNNDRFNQDIEEKENSDYFQSQQFFPGGQQPSTQPGRGGRPPSSPPNFTPEMPRSGDQSVTGSPNYGVQFRGYGFNRPRNYWGCLNRITYIWLFNGNNFWFYPTFIGRRQMEGFQWRQGRWVYERIYLNRILFFTCF